MCSVERRLDELERVNKDLTDQLSRQRRRTRLTQLVGACVAGVVVLAGANDHQPGADPTFDTVTVKKKLVVTDPQGDRIVLEVRPDGFAQVSVLDDLREGYVTLATFPDASGRRNSVEIAGKKTGDGSKYQPFTWLRSDESSASLFLTDGPGVVPLGMSAGKDHSGLQLSSRFDGKAQLHFRVDKGVPRFELWDTMEKLKGLLTLSGDAPSVIFQGEEIKSSTEASKIALPTWPLKSKK